MIDLILSNGQDLLINLRDSERLELAWTIAPAILLWLIAIPSLYSIYLQDEIYDPQVTVKAIASQWFWSYEYSDYVSPTNPESIAFDSFLLPDSDLPFGDLRQLALDQYLVLPIQTSIRFLISSNDVIHSFTVPSLGFKADAIPGRLNAASVFITRPGLYFGQCSELCGALHSAMPIGIQAVNLPHYLSFIHSHSLDS